MYVFTLSKKGKIIFLNVFSLKLCAFALIKGNKNSHLPNFIFYIMICLAIKLIYMKN